MTAFEMTDMTVTGYRHPSGVQSSESRRVETVSTNQPDTDVSAERAAVERVRSGLASLAIAFFLIVSVVGVVPGSETSALLDRLFGPTVTTTGLQQNWGVFSPDPMSIEVETHVLVYFEDGSSTRWDSPGGGRFDSSRSERWRKWESRVRRDENARHWTLAAQYVAGQFESAPSPVISVRLVRSWSAVPPAGEPNATRTYNEFHFYEWDPVTNTGVTLTEADQPTDGSNS